MVEVPVATRTYLPWVLLVERNLGISPEVEFDRKAARLELRLVVWGNFVTDNSVPYQVTTSGICNTVSSKSAP